MYDCLAYDSGNLYEELGCVAYCLMSLHSWNKHRAVDAITVNDLEGENSWHVFTRALHKHGEKYMHMTNHYSR